MATRRRSVLITGGGRGLGRAIGERLARDGARVGMLARTAAEVESAAAAIVEEGGEAWPLVADVLDAEGLNRAVGRFAGQAGGLDALVCAAGRFRAIGPLAAVEPDSWWLDLETTLRGVSRSIRAALAHLQASDAATIAVLIGPGHAGALPFGAAYAAGQAGLARLVESLAEELEPLRTRIYAVNPGLVPTRLMAHLLDSPEGRRWLPRFTEAFAEGKEVGPEVAAEAVAWLLSARPAELHGRIVPALLPPEILSTRLARIAADDLLRLRLR